MERDPDTAAKVQGVLFQILSVTRKLSASENRTEKKVGGVVQGQVHTNPQRKGKISRRQSPGYNAEAGPPASRVGSGWAPGLPGLISHNKKKTGRA